MSRGGTHNAWPHQVLLQDDRLSGAVEFRAVRFEEDGVHWPTVEHYFQAQKFPGAENAAYRDKIRSAKTPKEAKALGRTRGVVIRPDWEEAKETIMLHALRKKFATGKLQDLLLATGDRPLVEGSPFDSYWGCGRTGKGGEEPPRRAADAGVGGADGARPIAPQAVLRVMWRGSWDHF